MTSQQLIDEARAARIKGETPRDPEYRFTAHRSAARRPRRKKTGEGTGQGYDGKKQTFARGAGRARIEPQ